MVRRIGSSNGVVSRGAVIGDDFDFRIIATPRKRYISGAVSQSDAEVQDMVVDYYASATYVNEWDINIISAVSLEKQEQITFSSSNLAVATVDQKGVVTYVADGTVTIHATTPWLRRSVTVAVDQVAEGEVFVWKAWRPGTLAYAMKQAINSRIAGKTFQTIDSQILLADGSPNPDLWCADLDLTAFAVTTGGTRKGVAVSPHHALYSSHIGGYVGQWLSFYGSDGVKVSRQVAKAAVLGNDMTLLYFTQALPAAVTPAKVLPSTYNSYLPNLNKGRCPVAFFANSIDDCAVGQVEAFGSLVNIYRPDDAAEDAFWVKPIGGDSGDVVFGAADDQSFVLTNWWQKPGGYAADWTAGPHFSYFMSSINAKMTEQHGSAAYQLQPLDVSGYQSF